MSSDTTYTELNVLEIVGTGRRRRFSVTAKRQIVEESYSCGDSVTTVARRHGLFPAQLFSWRKLAREGAFGNWHGENSATGFIPVRIEAAAPQCQSTPQDACRGRFEVICTNGRRVIVDNGVDIDLLVRLIRGLESL
ncbi:transposase [Ochrobactrum sp. MC-1LL]|uniref:IS66-like element accessory protein TnpA n=1 Tax=Ochrobactrum sp. MC-1LL TaxID=2735351 RepID=UPI0014383709|nr:transposase [Ochrobactrum sp. MC-1LL]NKE74180.1 transposase [Ochrobactrum sp. MC-1LL]